MERHEAECVYNPNSKNCFMCEFSCIDDYEDYDPWCGNHTVKDVPQCVYTQEMLQRGDALTCEKFRRSKENNYSRSFKDAEANYERYHEGAVKDE
jgi:hypothetical protein